MTDTTRWQAPVRPLDHAESSLVTAVLDGTFPIGSRLPGERRLATMLGVTRPTLREALRRLERDGWFTIHHGKATVVNDYWHDGQLNVLATLARNSTRLPRNFVAGLLQVRADLAPSYARAAVHRRPADVVALCRPGADLSDDAAAFAAFDWQLHHGLARASDNPVYPLIMNGFAGLYAEMAPIYFAQSVARARSRAFYAEMTQLASAAVANTNGATEPIDAVETAVRRMMMDSIRLWPGRNQP